MAQPVFENGDPLSEYLRDSGDAPEVMPGGTSDFGDDESDQDSTSTGKVLRTLRSLLLTTHHTHPSPFAERFKYDVISSSLLSATFSTPLLGSQRLSTSTMIPGALHNDSRPASAQDVRQTRTDHSRQFSPADSTTNYWAASLAFVIAVALFTAGYYILTAITLAGTFHFVQFHRNDFAPKPDVMTPSMDALTDLISAGSMWDSTVNEAITMLETEERSIFYGPTTPSSPSSSLRVALHSSLHTTQTQCDNIRALFSALTLPSELSQLSEMYAPPSPMKLNFFGAGGDNPRPLSLPGSRRTRTLSASSSPPQRDKKRATWNGSYSALAGAGSPTMQVFKRREKRRSELSFVFGEEDEEKDSVLAINSAPVTPFLSDVKEEDQSQEKNGEGPEVPFGTDALNLRRKRKNDGLGTFGMSSHHASIPSTPHRATASISAAPSSASRFTTMQTTRHPLSLSALHHSLQNALASKRYACSHLLALRFDEEDEDEAYWEDVRSVMGLLTSTLGDAASRLIEALEEAADKKRKEQDPTPRSVAGDADSRSGSLSPSPPERKRTNATRSMAQMVSFAPMPSHLSRFAAHVDAVSTAMNDARDNLEQCVSSLREEPSHEVSEEDPALQAYERLRRELGLALRECERGRERLLDLIAASNPSPSGEEDPEDLPALGHDLGGSDESDKQDSHSPIFDFNRHIGEDPSGVTVVSGDNTEGLPDDATAHLLRMASSQHLPPQGIEQIFEAEPEPAVAFTRERSKLTREERIKMMRSRRESGGSAFGLPSDVPTQKHAQETWGPGGDVVQELKDVIYQVGERRRKMAESEL